MSITKASVKADHLESDLEREKEEGAEELKHESSKNRFNGMFPNYSFFLSLWSKVT